MGTRLNIGCSKIYKPGYINIDPSNDLIADSVMPPYELPFEDNSIEEIESYYLLEQLSYEKAFVSFYEWFRVLKEGGKLTIETPDIDSIIKTYSNEVDQPYKITNLKLMYETKNQKYKYQSGYYYYFLRNILDSVGFDEIEEKTAKIEPYREAFRIECIKPVNSRFNMAIVKTFNKAIREIDDITFELPQTFNELQEALINVLMKPVINNANETSYLKNELFHKIVAYSPKLAKIFASESANYNIIEKTESEQVDILANKLIKTNYISATNKAYLDSVKEPGNPLNYYMDLLEQNAAFIKTLVNADPLKQDEIIQKHLQSLFGSSKQSAVELAHDIFSFEIIQDKSKTLELMANKAFSGKDLNQASTLYSRSIQLNPNRSFAFINAGLIEAIQQNYKNALVFFNNALEVIETDSENDLVMLNMAMCYLILQDFNEAANYAEKVHIDTYDKHQTLGCAYFSLNKLDEALESFSWASITDQNAQSLINIGLVLTKLNKKDNAKKYFNNARAIDAKVNIPAIPYYPAFKITPYTKDSI